MTTNIEFKNGDITQSSEKYIVHQCNCISNYSLGLAKTIFEKFPYAECYINREKNDIAGTIQIKGNGLDQRYIINLFGQFSPGKPKKNETNFQRLKYFKRCLFEISKIPDLESVAFPKNIGCGLAGGNWDDYYNEILFFASKTNTKVVIYEFHP